MHYFSGLPRHEMITYHPVKWYYILNAMLHGHLWGPSSLGNLLAQPYGKHSNTTQFIIAFQCVPFYMWFDLKKDSLPNNMCARVKREKKKEQKNTIWCLPLLFLISYSHNLRDWAKLQRKMKTRLIPTMMNLKIQHAVQTLLMF